MAILVCSVPIMLLRHRESIDFVTKRQRTQQQTSVSAAADGSADIWLVSAEAIYPVSTEDATAVETGSGYVVMSSVGTG